MDLVTIERRSERHRLLLARRMGQHTTSATFAVALCESTSDIQELIPPVKALVDALRADEALHHHVGECMACGGPGDCDMGLQLLRKARELRQAALAPFEEG